jgi:hypothetical protein
VVLARLDRDDEIARLSSAPPELDEASLALLAQCHAAALDRIGRRSDAITVLRSAAANPHLSSDMRRVLAQADDAQLRRDSWLGFWFGPVASGARKAIGATLLIVGALITLGLAINPERVDWLSWRATGAEAALSLVIVAVLFLVPLATSLKVGGVEISVPAAPEPVLDPIDPVAISKVLDEAVVDLFVRARPLPAAGQATSQGVAVTETMPGTVLASPGSPSGTGLPATGIAPPTAPSGTPSIV